MMLVGDKDRVFQAPHPSNSAVEEGDTLLLDVASRPVVGGSLGEPQIAPMNLLCQIRIGDTVGIVAKHKSQQPVVVVEMCQLAYLGKYPVEVSLGRPSYTLMAAVTIQSTVVSSLTVVYPIIMW